MEKNPNETIPILDEHTAAHVAELFRAFSDTSRVRILSVLTAREMNVNALAQAFGISESAVSHHIRGLRQMHLVQARRDGKRSILPGGRRAYHHALPSRVLSMFGMVERYIWR